MSAAVDTPLTIAGFVALLFGVGFVTAFAPLFGATLAGDWGPDPPKEYGPFLITAIAAPPLVVIGEYVTAVVLAWRASGPTFYYPLIALAVGAASWIGSVGVIRSCAERAALRHRPPPPDPHKPYAVAGTVDVLSPAQIRAELGGGALFDDLVGHPGGLRLTPNDTRYKARALYGSIGKYHVYTVHPEHLPPGWQVEKSRIAPALGSRGGGTQYALLAPQNRTADTAELIDCGFLQIRASNT